jgi:nucleobase:cation symporter-1, NCS1 family
MTDRELVAGAGQSRVQSDEVFSIETHGVDTIPLEDRHGHPKELFFVWAAANTNYIYLILGSLVISFGLGFWPAVVAIVVAHSFYLLLGAAAIPGPKAGTATMVVSRSAFGVRGNAPYAFLSWITTVGSDLRK